jgi:hypothetical protein
MANKLTDYGMKINPKKSGISQLKSRSKKKDTKGIFVDYKNLYYPGYPAIPLMDMAARIAAREVNKKEEILKKYIRSLGSFSTKNRADLKRGGSQVHKTSSAFKRSKYKTASTVSTDNRTGRYGFEQITRKQSKKDTLGFSVFFDKKAFDIISKEISELVFIRANELIRELAEETVITTREKIKNKKSFAGTTVEKIRANPFRGEARIYNTLAESLHYYEKKKGALHFGRPISPLTSYGIGSFNFTSKVLKVSKNEAPTGIFGSRMDGGKFGGVSNKSLTQLYAQRVGKYKAKSSPRGGYETLKGKAA